MNATRRIRISGVLLLASMPILVGAQDSIPWPVGPGDEPYPVGFGYGDFHMQGCNGWFHTGIDIVTPPGEKVYAVADGCVTHRLKADSDTGGAYIIDGRGPGGRGYGYWHLRGDSMKVDVGDRVVKGQELGEVWFTDGGGFHHLHLMLTRCKADSPWYQHRADGNPLIRLKPGFDSGPPVFKKADAAGDRSFLFLEQDTRTKLDPAKLEGKVDIVALIYDRFSPDGSDSKHIAPHSVRFTIRHCQSGKDVLKRHSFTLKGPIEPGKEFTRVVYDCKEPAKSCGWYDCKEFYCVVTNTDGDGVIEDSDYDECWDTTKPDFPDGDYEIIVEAANHCKEKAEERMRVTVRNGGP